MSFEVKERLLKKLQSGRQEITRTVIFVVMRWLTRLRSMRIPL